MTERSDDLSPKERLLEDLAVLVQAVNGDSEAQKEIRSNYSAFFDEESGNTNFTGGAREIAQYLNEELASENRQTLDEVFRALDQAENSSPENNNISESEKDDDNYSDSSSDSSSGSENDSDNQFEPREQLPIRENKRKAEDPGLEQEDVKKVKSKSDDDDDDSNNKPEGGNPSSGGGGDSGSSGGSENSGSGGEGNNNNSIKDEFFIHFFLLFSTLVEVITNYLPEDFLITLFS